MSQNNAHEFDFFSLEKFIDSSFDPNESGIEIFIAVDQKFGNFERLELFEYALKKKFKIVSIVSNKAFVGAGVKIGPNCYIGPGAVIADRSSIGYNCYVAQQVSIGFGAVIRPSCWIDSGVNIGVQCTVGAHTTLMSGVLISPNVNIGKFCYIDIPGKYSQDISSKYTLDLRFDNPIVSYGS